MILLLVTCDLDDIDGITYPDTIYYRLHQVDYDGTDEYFDAVSVQPNGRVLADWWVGVGNPIEARCNSKPEECRFLPGEYDQWCIDYPSLCTALCNTDPLLCATLPIELVNFKVNFEGHGVRIEFTTSSEVGSDYVIIEGSVDYENWVHITQIPSKGAGDYEYFDNFNWL